MRPGLELVYHATLDESLELLQLAAETCGFEIVSDLSALKPLTVADIRARGKRGNWSPVVGLVRPGASRGIRVWLSSHVASTIKAGELTCWQIGKSVLIQGSAELAQVAKVFTSKMELHRTPLQEGWLSPRVKKLVLEEKVWLSRFAELTRSDIGVSKPRSIPALNIAPLRLLDVLGPKPQPQNVDSPEPVDEPELGVEAVYYKQRYRSVAHPLSPTARAIAAAIARLNGHEFPAVIIHSRGGRRCYICGGHDGRVVCEVGGRNLVDPDVAPGVPDSLQSIDNGQDDPFPAQWCVPKDMAIRAALYFAEHGTFDPDETWESGEMS